MVGQQFLGRYEAQRLLGEGGMGRVWLAHDSRLDRPVVVKVMHDHLAADPKFAERFQRETLLMARFQHPYAVALYDASLNDPQGPCIIMEYVRGVSLEELRKNNQGRLSAPRTGRLLGQLCEVLQAAHDQGIVHRDLKPSNLMIVDADTPYEKVKVLDFGVAKLLSRKNLTDPTGDFVLGTPYYACPELAKNLDSDHRGDLYSVGVILYELLTGRLPFTGNSTMELLLAHAMETVPSFGDVGMTELSPAVEEVVLSCLAKEPQQRPASARDLAARFQQALLAPDLRREQVLEPSTPSEEEPAPFDRIDIDDKGVAFHMEAVMPQGIAEYKLRGFISDAGGQVMESIPGLIRVRLGARGTRYQPKSSPLAWLSRRSGLIEMHLYLHPRDPKRQDLQRLTVLMRSLDGENASNTAWRRRCDTIYGDLRSYLMGTDRTS
jgi:serine/threonine protein kinase